MKRVSKTHVIGDGYALETRARSRRVQTDSDGRQTRGTSAGKFENWDQMLNAVLIKGKSQTIIVIRLWSNKPHV